MVKIIFILYVQNLVLFKKYVSLSYDLIISSLKQYSDSIEYDWIKSSDDETDD